MSLHLTSLITHRFQLKGKFSGQLQLYLCMKDFKSNWATSLLRELLFSVLLSAASLLPHRFVTVRRGSPAAKSGQIRPGDRLEAVEGRPVVTLPHRELAQILRRAGNTLRLTIIPRPSTCKSRSRKHSHTHKCTVKSGSQFITFNHPLLQILQAIQKPMSTTLVTEAGRVRGCVRRWGQHRVCCSSSHPLPVSCIFPQWRLHVLLLSRSAPVFQRDSRYYSVDLDRGPSGFGFSLRGGSEYNMGLYVLGLMEGGPASRSQKMQVCLPCAFHNLSVYIFYTLYYFSVKYSYPPTLYLRSSDSVLLYVAMCSCTIAQTLNNSQPEFDKILIILYIFKYMCLYFVAFKQLKDDELW